MMAEANNTNYVENDAGLKLTGESRANLGSTSKWAMFLAILGFVSIGVMVIFGFFFGIFFSMISKETMPHGFPSYLFGLIYLILGAIYFFPILYLYRFSSFIKKALLNNDSEEMDKAFSNLKAHYKFMGILMIVVLGIYVLVFAGMIIGGIIGRMM